MALGQGDALAGLGLEGVQDAPAAVEAWKRHRPSMPPLLIAALSQWLVLAVAYDSLRTAPTSACLALACGGVAIAAAALFLVRAKGKAALACCLLGCALGLLCAGSGAYALHADEAALQGTSGDVDAVLSQDAMEGQFGVSCLVSIERGNGSKTRARLNFKKSDSLKAGDSVRAHVTWKAPSKAAAADCWRKGIAATATAYSLQPLETIGAVSLLRGFRDAALERIASCEGDADGRLLMQSILLGYREGLYDSDLYNVVRVDGLAHLVAVSGAHLVIVCGIALTVLRRFRLAKPVVLLLQFLFICGYLVLTGVPVSALRAAVMTMVALSAFIAKRRSYPLGGLALCIMGMLAVDSTTAFSMSFILSASSTLGIILFSGFFKDWVLVLLHLRKSALAETLALTFSAIMVTSPMVAAEFGQFSLVAPLANLIAAPFFTIICGGGLIIVVLVTFIPLVMPLLAMALHFCTLFCFLLEALAALPYAAIPASLDSVVAVAATFAAPMVLWAVWPHPSARAATCVAAVVCIIACFAIIILPAARPDGIIMLDVGQGDAFVLVSKGKSLLVDTGTDDAALLEGLARHGIYALDAVLISHPDDDHCGSLKALKGVVRVGKVLVASDLLTCNDASCKKLVRVADTLVGANRVEGLAVGECIEIGAMDCSIIGPDGFTDDGGNADSVVMVVNDDIDGDGTVDWRALFCGDAEAETLAKYQAKGRIGAIDIYKVGHHGSRAALTEAVAAALHPKVSLVSVGANNRYGHPVALTLQLLQKEGSGIWRTDQQGDIVCELQRGTVKVCALG